MNRNNNTVLAVIGTVIAVFWSFWSSAVAG